MNFALDECVNELYGVLLVRLERVGEAEADLVILGDTVELDE